MRETTQIAGAVAKLFADVPGAKFCAAVFGALLGYLFPTEAMRGAAAASLGMIVLDMVTGIAAGMVSGQAISSARFSRTLTKMLAYGSLIVVSAVVPKHVIGAGAVEGISVTLICSVILLNESISIAENAEKMGYGFPWLRVWLRERLDQAALSVKEREEANDGANDAQDPKASA